MLRVGGVLLSSALAALAACQTANRPSSGVSTTAIADTVRRLTDEMFGSAEQVSADRFFARVERGADFAFGDNGRAYFSADSRVAAGRRYYAGLRGQDIDVRATKVTVLGPDAAVLTGHGVFTYTDTAGVTSAPTPLVVTVVWARREGQWRAVHLHQSFPVPGW